MQLDQEAREGMEKYMKLIQAGDLGRMYTVDLRNSLRKL